jgi:uncharacterized membrane protein HdeD (DUF308 family)
MLQQLLRKWWVILLQGILLVALSFYIFTNPAAALAGISIWFGTIVLVTGLIGIMGWLFGDKKDRESMSLLWSVLTFAVGILMLLHLLATAKILTVVLGIWVLVSGILLLQNGLLLKNNNYGGWIMIILGVLSAVVALMMIFDISTGAVAITSLLGLQVLVTGISLMLLSLAKKMLLNKVSDKLGAMR